MKRKTKSPAQQFVWGRKFNLKGTLTRVVNSLRGLEQNEFLHPHEKDGIREAILELGPLLAHFDTYTRYLEKERKL